MVKKNLGASHGGAVEALNIFPPEMGYEMMANVSTSQMVLLLLLFSFLENRKTYMILMKNCIIVGEATKGKRK